MFNIKTIKPLHNMVVCTANVYDCDKTSSGGIILPEKRAGTLKEFQTVRYLGPMVRHIEIGDTIIINPAAYAVYGHKEKLSDDPQVQAYGKKEVISYNFVTEEVDGEKCLVIYDRDVSYVVTGEEVEEPLLYSSPKVDIIQ